MFFNYSYFTKKQANIVYAAYKRGDIAMTKAQTRMLYHIVGITELNDKEHDARSRFELAIDAIFEHEYAIAQRIIDGEFIYKGTTIVCYDWLTEDPMKDVELDEFDLLFADFQEPFTPHWEPRYETGWLLEKRNDAYDEPTGERIREIIKKIAD